MTITADTQEPAVRPTCPRCGSSVFYDLACHTWSRRRDDGTEQWMSCMPCDSAIEYACDGNGREGDGCDWDYTHGLNPHNPRSAVNEASRPPWLPGKFNGNVVAGCRMFGTDYISGAA